MGTQGCECKQESMWPCSWGQAVTLDEALCARDACVSVTAPVHAGKTEYVVRTVARLAQEGFASAQILVVASTPVAALALHRRLVDVGCADVAVQTPYQLFTSLLDTSEARACTGRVPRVLCAAERNMLIEDAKFAGAPLSVLRACLAKMTRGFARGNDVSSWGFDAEEQAFFDSFEVQLTASGAVLQEELPLLAAQYVRQSPELRYRAVLVDDAQELSSATLAALRALAADFFAAAGNPNQARSLREEGDAPQGFASFVAEDAVRSLRIACAGLDEDAQRTPSNQPIAIARFADGLTRAQGMEPGIVTLEDRGESLEGYDRHAIELVKWREPANEFRGAATAVQHLLASDDQAEPSDVYVVVPNRAWAAMVQRAFDAARVPAQTVFEGDPIKGDPRRAEACAALAPYCALAIAVDADDQWAWRLWMALGDARLRCRPWSNLLSWAKEQDLFVGAAIRALAERTDEPFEGAAVLRERVQELDGYLEKIQAAQGFVLRKVLLDIPGGVALKPALNLVKGDESPAQMLDLLRGLSFEPRFESDCRFVNICTAELLGGLLPRYVIMLGLIDGLVPKGIDPSQGAADPAYLRQLRVFYATLGKARKALVLSTVQFADEELAEKQHLSVRRIRECRGQRKAVLGHSPFFNDAGDAACGFVSGEQYLG